MRYPPKRFGNYLKTWIELSTRKRDRRDPQKELIQLLLNLILAIVFGVLPLPVYMKWGGWILCFLGLVYVIQAHNPIARFPKKSRILLVLVLPFVFILGFSKTIDSQWVEEQSAKSSGDLIPQGLFQATQIIVEYGDSGRKMPWTEASGGGDLKLMYDAGIHLDLGHKGIELTTVIRDSQGQKVVEVDRNHWTVSQFPVVTDKNFTKDSLEVLDRRGHVVLQVRILPDRIQLQGEWRDDLGRGIRITTCKDKNTNFEITGCLQSWLNSVGELSLENIINPVFLYPSKEHWRERVSGH